MVDIAEKIFDVSRFVTHLRISTHGLDHHHLEIDDAYLTANHDVMATFFSSNIFKSPLLVIVVAVSFLLPIPTIFTPSSLRVVSRPVVEPSTPCSVPTGNLTNGGSGSTMYGAAGWGYWTGITPVAQKLATSTFIGQKIPSLPQTCGLNCTYSVSLHSIAFRCKNSVEIPPGLSTDWPDKKGIGEETFWNATTNSTDGGPADPFYIYWKSTTQSGTNGTAMCTVGTAQYNFTVCCQSVISTMPSKGFSQDKFSKRTASRQLQCNAYRRSI